MPIEVPDALAYVDTSAFAKLLKREHETEAIAVTLSEWDGALVSSVLLEPELRRVAVRYGLGQDKCDELLEAVTLLDLDDSIRRRTGSLGPTTLRALDSVHLATALALGERLAVLFAYDDRLVEAALLAGVPTNAPAPAA